jgi:hypothetical protein
MKYFRTKLAAFLMYAVVSGAMFSNAYPQTTPDGVITSVPQVASQAEFESVARTYHQGTPYSLPHAMFVIDRRENNKIYYINSLRYRFHKDFLYATYLVPLGADVFEPVYINEDRRFIVGSVAWQQPVEKFTWEIWEGDMATAEHLTIAHKVINNTFFSPVAYKPNSSRQEEVSAGIKMDRVLQTEIIKNQEYLALNPGTAVGRIHIIDKLDDTVEIGDNEIVILRELPMSLPPVRGIIVAKPSSPLSHAALADAFFCSSAFLAAAVFAGAVFARALATGFAFAAAVDFAAGCAGVFAAGFAGGFLA